MPNYWNNAMHSRINVYGPRRVQTRGRFGRTRTVTQPGASVEVGGVVVLGGIVAVGIIGAELISHGAKSAYRGLANQKPRVESLLENISSSVNSIVTKIGGKTGRIEKDTQLAEFSSVSGIAVAKLGDYGVYDEEGLFLAVENYYELENTPTSLQQVADVAKANGR